MARWMKALAVALAAVVAVPPAFAQVSVTQSVPQSAPVLPVGDELVDDELNSIVGESFVADILGGWSGSHHRVSYGSERCFSRGLSWRWSPYVCWLSGGPPAWDLEVVLPGGALAAQDPWWMGGSVYMLTTSRLLRWGLLLPLILLPLSLLEQRKWWQHLVLPVGGYLVVVLGTLAGWKLTRLAERAGSVARFVTRALVGTTMLLTIFVLAWVGTLSTGREFVWWTDWRLLALAVVFGVSYALPPSRWLQKGQQKGHDRRQA